MGRVSGHAPGEVPASHLDLVQCPPVAALTTVTRGGYPQSSVAWCDFDGECVRVNTMRGFAKERNMRRDPRVTLLCFDPREPLRYLEVRGAVVDMTEVGAGDHLDDLASAYAGRRIRYFGDAIPARFAESETPVLCRIKPTHVVAVDARGGRDGSRGCDVSHGDAGNDGGRRHAGAGGDAMTPRPVVGIRPLPASHLDLLTRAIDGVLTTMGADGQPQSSLVWVDVEGECARVNTTLERQKGRNLVANPKVSLLLVDPDDTTRYLQLRGDAELVREGALAHLDALTRTYTREPHFYGYVYPVARRSRETRVICVIHARRVTCDAIHAATEVP